MCIKQTEDCGTREGGNCPINRPIPIHLQLFGKNLRKSSIVSMEAKIVKLTKMHFFCLTVLKT